jgi:hypothetical protein
MLTPDHPNAFRMADFFRDFLAVKIADDLDAQTKKDKAEEVRGRINFSPDVIVHQAGNKLAATGDLAFGRAVSARRGPLCGGRFRLAEISMILADDSYSMAYGTFHAERGDESFEAPGMYVWRYDPDGLLVEQWECMPGDAWDQFIFSGDPDYPGNAREFWLKDQV